MSKNIFLLALVLGLFKSYSQQVTTCYVGTSSFAISGYSCASSTTTIGTGSTPTYCVYAVGTSASTGIYTCAYSCSCGWTQYNGASGYYFNTVKCCASNNCNANSTTSAYTTTCSRAAPSSFSISQVLILISFAFSGILIV